MTAKLEHDPPLQGSLEFRPWYQPWPKQVGSDVRRILEKHGIPAAEVEKHIVAVRDRAWRVAPYVCLGKFWFIEMKITRHPCFRDILSRLMEFDGRLLDVGCGLGQELRLLVDCGVKGSQIVGMDPNLAFIELGYELFCDRRSLTADFVSASILEKTSIPTEMYRQFDIIWGAASFHLFNWEKQILAFTNALMLLKDCEDTALYGWQAGHHETKSMPDKKREGKVAMFWHNAASFEELWNEIGLRTSTRWRVTSWFGGEIADLSDDMVGVVEHVFAVKRIAGSPGLESGMDGNDTSSSSLYEKKKNEAFSFRK